MDGSSPQAVAENVRATRHGLRLPGRRRFTHRAFLRRIQKLAETGDQALLEQELRLYEATRCRARTRRGTPCKRVALKNGRCPNHGGLSTGPKTAEGRRRALANLRQYRGLTEAELDGALASP
jgi:hypothetical protein